MNKLLLLLPLLIGCSGHNPHDAPVDPDTDPPSVHENCTDWESAFTDLEHPQFVGHFEIPDHYFVCGDGGLEEDFYWFIANQDFLFNAVVDTSNDAVAFMNLWTISVDQVDNEFVFVYEHKYTFFGDPGQLVALDFPMPATNYGFLVGITTLGFAEYQLETWPW